MIRIHLAPEPFSPTSLSLDPENEPIVIESNVERLLRQELVRYCNGEVDGRSFLIAGHRGSGKTTTVLNALLQVWRMRENGKVRLRPLPVLLQGPALFPPVVMQKKPDRGDSAPGALSDPSGDAAPVSAARSQAADPAALVVVAPMLGPAAAGAKASATAALDETVARERTSGEDGQPRGEERSEHPEVREAENALVQIILGLHRAVSREFVRGYWQRTMKAEVAERLRRRHWGAQPAELAAQFEAELMECPPPIRMREFWELADAVEKGVLFDRDAYASAPKVPHWFTRFRPLAAGTAVRNDPQGARELVALDGIVRAYRRLTGKFSQSASETSNATRQRTASTDVSVAEALKPFVSLATGAAFAGGVALSTQSAGRALLAGLAGAIAAGLVFKFSSVRTQKTEYAREEKWIPNRDANTLDRVLPTIIDRLRAAGLAPVFIIDELDKVHGLSMRLQSMVHHLKKLVAENALFCFLADRSYFEDLQLRSDRKTYGVDYSYYSFRRLVCFRPEDMDQYLRRSMHVIGNTDQELDSDTLDAPLIRLVLRHRSEMHALSLKRELAVLRGDSDELQIPTGDVRTRMIFRIDLTFQFAIERALALESVSEWLAQHPEKVQTLYDALYYLSRKWKSEQYAFDLSEREKRLFARELERRMNLDEARTVTPVKERDKDSESRGEAASLGSHDVEFLFAKVVWLARTLAAGPTDDPIQTLKAMIDSNRSPEMSAIDDARLRGGSSVLVLLDRERQQYEFRYYRSGEKRELGRKPPERSSRMPRAEGKAPVGQVSVASRVVTQQERDDIEFIVGFEEAIWPLWRTRGDPDRPNGRLFAALSDQFRVLPTTPAPATVQRAIERLANVEPGAPVDPVIADDLTCLKEFAAILRAAGSLVLRVLVMAAFFGAVAGAAETAIILRRGLECLARGLRFAQRNTAEIAAAVGVVTDRLASVRDFEGVARALADLPRASITAGSNTSALVGVVGAFAKQAAIETEKSIVDWREIEKDGWMECELRVLAFVKNGVETDAELNELLCMAAHKGPGRVLTAALSDMTLNAWTSTFVGGLVGTMPASTSAAGENVPRWLAVLSLARLGLRIMNPGHQAHLAMRLTSVLRDSSEYSHVRDLIESGRVLPDAREEFGGSVLFIRRKHGSLAQSWRQTVAGYLVLTPTMEEMNELVRKYSAQEFLELLPWPLVIAWEQEPDSLRDENALAGELGALLGARRFATVWVYPHKREQAKTPSVFAPRDMNDVIEAATRSPAPAPVA